MKKSILKSLTFFIFLGLIPNLVNAANLYFETSREVVSVGDTFIISAKIDTKKTPVNSIEGDFVFKSNNDNLIVNDFSLAKSIFSLWPRTPSLSEDGNTISFVGGVPGGFDLDKAILFNMVFEANKEGIVTISPENIAVFANDGNGTRVPVDIKSLAIEVVAKNEGIAPTNEWSGIVLNDKTNPEKFDIVIGRESSLFDGRRFAFFTAVDNQSGISYYEVSENGNAPIRSGSTYILENQNENTKVDLVVTAYDKAGNKITSVYENPSTRILGAPLSFVIIIISLIVVGLIAFKIIKKKKNVYKI